MSADRELLALAAKAIGWTITGWNHQRAGAEVAVLDDGGYWQPLLENGITDCDGDALRLAAKLDFKVCTTGYGPYVASESGEILAAHPECTASEKLPAIRRQIVRAAAEIGKAMP